MIVLVTGSRDWSDHRAVFAALDTLHADHVVTELLHGAARGADSLAAAWAEAENVLARAFPADWSKGRSAGPARTRAMLDWAGDAALVLAFPLPTSRGTWDTIHEAARRGLEVWIPQRVAPRDRA